MIITEEMVRALGIKRIKFTASDDPDGDYYNPQSPMARGWEEWLSYKDNGSNFEQYMDEYYGLVDKIENLVIKNIANQFKGK